MYDILHMVQTLGTTDEKVLWARLNGRYPFWTKPSQYSFRLRWLLSLGAVAEAGKRYTITPIGAQALQQFAGQQPNAAVADEGEDADDAEHESNTSDEMPIEAAPATTPSAIELEGRVSEASSTSEAESIVASILAAAHDSSNPTRFELTLVDAFRFLGFEAEHKSGAGDTDVLVRAPLGKEHYRAVVDAKASHKNTSGQINWKALEKHKDLYHADYILVVAPGFSSGDVRKYAEEIGAALLSAEDLSSIVSQHVVTPLSLDDLRALFTSPGDPTSPLRHISERAKQIQHAHQLLSDVIRTFVDGQQSGMFELTVDVVQFGLSRDYRHTVYTKEEIASVLDMLCIPVLGALRRDGPDIFCLRMSPLTIVRRLQAMASILTSAMEQEHWPANVPQASHVRRR